ncbi:MAG: hypothetical protein A3K19_26050 [Lentisphaerae bacterium RIFOXYB12_FULL_65_16]|nr:MAG: hypothetical protein A3K18_08710 [Lentisphaerae bacterium RIFOXYA12_64_32]OGV87731.1 MAG: hypothetical protein A3K19_26050 [Lentisphaerae bacterium RIFOXYB12_FULL_65_16]
MVQSVDKALVLLNEVARHGDWVGVRELARATGLKPPTAQSLLKTLQAHGFLEFDAQARGYRVGLAALRLADGADRLTRLADFARPFVRELFAEFGETVAALTLVQDQAVVLEWQQAEHALAVIHARKVIERPHFMASGLVLIAYQDVVFRQRYAERVQSDDAGQNMPKNAAQLLKILDQVRAQGYAETCNARGSGIGAVSAPVFDATGHVAMALACSAPLARLNDGLRERQRASVISTAARMSAALGGADAASVSVRRPASTVSHGPAGFRPSLTSLTSGG